MPNRPEAPDRHARLDSAVLATLPRDILRPKVIRAVVDGALRELAPAARGAGLVRQQHAVAVIDRKIESVIAAIEAGGRLPALLGRLRARQAERKALAATLAQFKRSTSGRSTGRT